MSLGTRAVYNKQWRPPLQPMAVKIERINMNTLITDGFGVLDA
jgi:hypothetical protein